jgi:acetylornithine deacetylase
MVVSREFQERIQTKVEELQEEAIQLLSELTQFSSLLGQEKEAQQWMENQFQQLGLNLQRVPLTKSLLESKKGYSPVSWALDDKFSVIATHIPQVTKGN